MSTWSVALTTGLVTGSFTLTAAVLPRLVDSKADKACRADEKAERRRDEKKAAFAAYLAAAAELIGSSIDHEPGDELTARGHAAMQGVVNAAIAAELVSTVPELRRALAATFGLMGAPFDETSAFGEHMETIRTLMAADLAAE